MAKVLNIGSLNIDKTYHMERFVRPKETVKALGYEEFCGGKGLNQSIALARAGAEVYHAGAVGRDGGPLLDILRKSGVHTEHIRQLDMASGHAIIQVDAAGQNSIIVYGGSNLCVSREHISAALEDFSAGDILLLQNEISNVDFAISEAKKRGMVIALNPSPFDDVIAGLPLDMVDYFLLNEVEGGLLAQAPADPPEEILGALRSRYPDAAFVLTLGEDGACFCGGGLMLHQDIYKVHSVDTTGAGDTFGGYFIAGIAAGRDTEQILRQASAAAAISVSRRGAAPGIPAMDEVEKMVQG